MFDYFKALAGMYLPQETEGQGMVEYGLILVLVSVVVITLLTTMGTSLQGVFQNVVNGLGG